MHPCPGSRKERDELYEVQHPPSTGQDEDKVVELLRLHLFDTQNQFIDRLILYIPGPSWLGLPPDRQSKAPRGPRHGLGNVDYAGDARS